MLTLLLAFQAGVLAPADTPRPAHDALHYDIRITLPARGKVLNAEVETRWRLLSSDPLRVELDSALQVSRIGIDGGVVTGWRRTGDVITIPHGHQKGDTVTTVIAYSGAPRDGLIIRDSSGVRTIFADNWPNRAHRWFPSQDYPSDKATVTFRISAPKDYQVIANGDSTGTLPEQRQFVHSFDMKRPIAVYTMVIGAAHMSRTPMGEGGCAVRCVPVEVWTYPADSAFAVNGPFRRASRIVDYFTSVIGEFPYTRLTHVQSSTIFGGMENSTAIFYDEKAYRTRRMSESTVAHETAHQWFGDAVTERDWTHLWLSEGFATYFAALWAEHLGGDSAMQATMRTAARGIYRSPVTNHPIIDSTPNLLDLLNTNNYNKGSWVLHSLRGLIGDSSFFRGIREYYRRYRDSTALSTDFEAVMEAASGQDLAWYFRQALTQPGYPRLDIRVTFDSTSHSLGLVVRQTQPDAWGVYRLPGYELLIDDLLVRVDLEGRESTFSFDQFTKAPTSVEADPSGWWLTETVVEGRGKK
jgi:aminopeptidase N